MTKLVNRPSLFVLSLVSLTATSAHATLVVRVTDSTGVQTFQVGNPNCPGCTANTIVATASDPNFSIHLNISTSNAPGGPAMLTSDSILNSNFGSAGAPNDLKVEVSDTGFLTPIGPVNLVQRGTTNESAIGFATGSVSSAGYYGAGASGNVLFCQAVGTCNGSTGTLNFTSFALNTQQDQLSTSFASPFSLVEVINFRFTSAGSGQFSASLRANAIPGTPVVTGQTPGPPRNNFTGFVGFQFTVGATPISVYAIGRFYVPGNTGTHLVKLVNASGVDVPGGSTTVAEAGGILGQYQYGVLSNPLTLQANTSYYVVSQESAGGDQFYDYGPITMATGVTVNGPAYADTSNTYNTVSTLPGQAYGPVSFLFGVQSSVLSATVTSPAGNAMIAGNNVPVIVATTGPVTTLQLQVDNANKGNPVTVAANQSSPYTLSLDTTTLSNASHQLRVVVSDGQNNTATSSAVNVTVSNAGGGSTTAFVIAQSPGGARNNFTGFVGMEFTVGSTPLSVTSLGRLFLSGNTGTHMLKLVNAGTNGDVPGGSVQVSLAGGSAGQYNYGLLASPVTLQPNTSYYLLSQETTGGDMWDDLGPVTPTSAAVVNGPAYVDGNGTYVPVTTLPGNAYGPVNFTYAAATSALSVSITSPANNATVSGNSVAVTVATGGPVTSVQLQIDGSINGPASVTPPYTLTLNTTGLTNGSHTLLAVASNGLGQSVASSPVMVTVNNGAAPNPTPFLTGSTPGAARNNFTGFVGLSFTVGVSSITVTQLGRIYVSGNSGTHTLKLVDASTGADVPNALVQLNLAGGGTPGQLKYATLTTPVTLQANTTYYVLSFETSGGDTWYDFGPVTSTNAGHVNGPAYTDGNNAYVVVSTLPNYAYGPVGFTY